MKEADSNRDDYLLLNNKSSEESNTQTNKSLYKDEFNKYIKAGAPKEIDIQSLIQQFKELPCCLNEFLEKNMKNQDSIILLLEIRRRNLKIKLFIDDNPFNYGAICQWCLKHCFKSSLNSLNLEKEINITATNSKICSCGLRNHEENLHRKSGFKIDSDEQKEIDKIIDLCNDFTTEERQKLIKEEIMKLMEGKSNDKILQIICNMINLDNSNFICVLFNLRDYNDEIHSKILSCLKESKHYSDYGDYIGNYISVHYFKKVYDEEIPIYNFSFNNSLPVLYYYHPDIFSYSFFFQVYRKRIISKNIESNDCITFLRKLGINNEIICSTIKNYGKFGSPSDLFIYGFSTLDSISKIKGKDVANFLPILHFNSIDIFINQLCEIFSDFIFNGETKHISLMDISNHVSKILIEYVFNGPSFFYMPQYHSVKPAKIRMIAYILFNFFFYEENKLIIMNLLSSYSLILAHKQNIFKDSEDYSEIFESIENEVKIIITKKKIRKNNSQQNIFIVNKLLDLYQLEYENIEELYLYDFNNLLQNIIEIDYPIKIANKVLELMPHCHQIEESKSLKIYLEYIKKVILLCNTNIVGSSYIYNSNFIPKIMKIIQYHLFNDHYFNDYSNYLIELLIILKQCFNRTIIDVSLLAYNNIKQTYTTKEYLLDILFKNEPVISNATKFNFSIFDNLLDRIKTIYSFVFEKENIQILPNSFINIKFEDSYLEIIKTIFLNMEEEFNQMKLKEATNNLNILQIVGEQKVIEDNEKILEKKINEEIVKIKNEIPGFILVDLLRCFENLNQTNFYLKYDKNSYLIDDKYDLTSIIINDKLPLAVKSIILNFLLKLVLSLKIDPNSNIIYGPLLYSSSSEKVPNSQVIKGKYFVTLESNESEKHMYETVKLINILIICIELLKKKENSLNFEKAFIEKNGLYNYCVSIIQGILYLSSLIVNTNKIHDLYL